MRQVSLKRQRQYRERPVNTDERICEACYYAEGVTRWLEYRPKWDGMLERHEIDPHHVFRERHHGNPPWNTLWVCRPFHEFTHKEWEAGGTVISLYALWHLGRFDYLEAASALQRNPLWRVGKWHLAGEFAESPLVRTYAETLMREHGMEVVQPCRPEVDL
jgi:hypothetical protein